MKKISRLISVIHRHGMRFFDWSLADTEIGPGQQFFLVCIYENPGISMQKLAKIGHFDKGTVTKAVKKMEDQGYLSREPDVCDKRVQHLFTTREAEPALQMIFDLRGQWNEILLQNLSEEEIQQAELLLTKISDNAYSYIQNRRLKSFGNTDK